MSSLSLIRPELASIEAYAAHDRTGNCLLHANELPWAPTIENLELKKLQLNRYPSLSQQHQLEILLANLYQIKANELLLTRGSDEGIDLLMRLFIRAGIDSVMQCPPTFPMYEFYARLQSAALINCPLQENEEGFNLDRNTIKASWASHCKLIVLCSPNNPTGELIELSTIAELCEEYKNRSIIVVDEAYIEFSESESASTLIHQFDNLIVLRTLSKAYGLAGLRLGAVIAHSQMIEQLKKIVAPFIFSSAVVEIALRVLQDQNRFVMIQENIRQLRVQLADNLSQSPWIEKVYPSAANFLLVKTGHAKALTAWFQQNDIAIRSFTELSPLQNFLRITVGDAVQNKQLLTVLNGFEEKL